MIIHIAGPKSFPKRELAKQLKRAYGDDILINDLDMLLEKFLTKNKYTTTRYQHYIDEFIDRNKSKDRVVIFTGLNKVPTISNKFYDIHPDEKLFVEFNIDTETKEVFTSRYKSIIHDIFELNKSNDYTNVYDKWVKDEKSYIDKAIKSLKILSPLYLRTQIRNSRNHYKKQYYTFIKYTDISNRVGYLLKANKSK